MMQCKAVVQRGEQLVEESVTLPALGDHQVLVRIQYAALNPTDVLAFDLNAFGDGAILGCDFAGKVEQVGAAVTKFSVGDNIAALVWGGEVAGLGAYSEYCIAEEAIAYKIPDNISLQEAATVPLVAATAWLALFSRDCLNLNQREAPTNPLLILGGSSSVGSFANQIASLHGITSVTTSSKKNINNCKADGASAVYDYKDKDILSQILADHDKLDTVFDTIGSPASTETVAHILGDRQSNLCTVRPGKAHCDKLSKNINVTDVFVFTVFLKPHSYRGKAFWPPNPENHALGKQLFNELPDLLLQGKLRPRPVKSMGRLNPENVKKAMDLVRSGQVSNEKLCFAVHD